IVKPFAAESTTSALKEQAMKNTKRATPSAFMPQIIASRPGVIGVQYERYLRGPFMNRREFIRNSAALGVIAASGVEIGFSQAPGLITGKTKPVVISSNNGNFFKNGGKVTCVEHAYSMLTKGSDVLDSVIAGVNIVELDPEECYVGYGGLPNA